MKARKTNPDEQPKRRDSAEDLTRDLLTAVRGQFYSNLPEKRWFQEYNLILSNVVLWPAKWLDDRGVSLPPHRYKEAFLGVLDTVKRNGDTANIKTPARYLAMCVQSHFKVNGDRYYEEAKATRSVAGDIVDVLRKSIKHDRDPVAEMAVAGRKLEADLRVKGGRKKAVMPPSKPLDDSSQLALF